LIIFGILFVVGGLIHPRGEGVSSEQTMEIIRSQATAWRASHLLTGLSLIFGAAAGLVILVTRTRVASGPLALAGWSLIAIVSSLFSLPFVSESTVVADVAIVGDAEAFDQWYGGFVGGIEGAARPFILIGFFLVAIHQFRSASPLLPRWTSAVAGRLAPRLRLRVRSPVEHPRSAQLRIRIPRPGPLVARVGRSADPGDHRRGNLRAGDANVGAARQTDPADATDARR